MIAISKTISAIWAQDLNGALGYKNKLLANLPKDLARFKSITFGKVCVMGKATFESIIDYNNQPLPDRHTVVLSSSSNFDHYENVTTYKSYESLMEDLNNDIYPFSISEEIIVCGGQEVYKDFRRDYTTVYQTVISEHFFNADRFIEISIGKDFPIRSYEKIFKDDEHKFDMSFITKVKEVSKK